MTPTALDAAGVLTGPAAEQLLRAALAPEGATLVSWSIDEVNARPGAETSVGYEVRSSRAVGGRELVLDEYLVASTHATGEVPAGCVRLTDPDDPEAPAITIWRHPHDPLLPALPKACDLKEVRKLWQRVLPDGAEPGDESVEIVGYRPMRRAVVRARHGDYLIFLKVVRPKKLRELVRRHRLLEAAGVPTPPVLEHSREGILVLDHAEGTRAVDRIARTDPADQATALDPAVLVGLLDRLPAAAAQLPRRRAWADNYPTYAAFLDNRLGGTDARDLGRQLAAVVDNADLGPVVPTHGDFHAANVFLDTDGGISSLLDVDTLGPGHRVDDLACLLAHLAVLPTLNPEAYAGVPALVDHCLAAFAPETGEPLLRARAAACVVSLACGADTDDLAREWFTVAHRLAAKDLLMN